MLLCSWLTFFVISFAVSSLYVMLCLFPLAWPIRRFRGSDQTGLLIGRSWQPSFLESHTWPPRTSSSEELLAGVRVPIVPALAGFAACTMAPVVSKPVRWVRPLGEVRVVYEAVYLSEAAVGPTRPIRLAVLIGFRKGRGSVDRQYL